MPLAVRNENPDEKGEIVFGRRQIIVGNKVVKSVKSVVFPYEKLVMTIYSKTGKALGSMRLDESGDRPQLEIVLCGTTDILVDAFGLNVKIIREGPTERHKLVEMTHDGWNQEAWEKNLQL